MGNVEGQELNLEGLTPEQRHHLQQQHELKRQQQQLLQEQQQLQQRLQHQQGGLQPQQQGPFSKQEEIQRLSPRKQQLQQQPSPQQPQQREVQYHQVQKHEQQRQQEQQHEQHRQPYQLQEEKRQQVQQREQQRQQPHYRDSQQREQQSFQQRQVQQRQKQQEQHQVEQQQDHHQQREQQSLHHQPQRHPQQQQKRLQSSQPQNSQRYHSPQQKQPQHMQLQQPKQRQPEQQSNNEHLQHMQVQRSLAPRQGSPSVDHRERRGEEHQNMQKFSESFKNEPNNMNKQQLESKDDTQGVNLSQDNLNKVTRRLNDDTDRSLQEGRRSPAGRDEHRRPRSSSPGQDQKGRDKNSATHLREGTRTKMTRQSESGKPIRSDQPDERQPQHRTGQKTQKTSSPRQERKMESGSMRMHDNASHRPGSPHKSGTSIDAKTISDRQSIQHLPLQKVSQTGQHQQEPDSQQSANNISPSTMKMQFPIKSPVKSPMKSPMRSPMMPPAGDPFGDPAANLEADLSQLTEEERAHILAVLDRARQLQEKDENRVREMEQSLENFTKEVTERDYQSDSVVQEVNSCPICHKLYRKIGSNDNSQTSPDRRDCDDCGRTVCPGCGSIVQSVDSERERWLCDLCQRRRRFLATSGLWHKFHSQIQEKSSKSRRSSLDEAFMAIQPPTKTRHRLVRTASYSMVDDMRKTLHDEEKEPDTTEKRSKEENEAGQTKTETSSLVDSDELREEFLLLKRRSRDRSPEYERRTSAGQEEVLRDLRREERGFLISDNTIEMDPIDADHVEDLSEGLDEEEMMRQLMEMADGVDEDFGSFSDHSSSSGAQYFADEIDDKHGEHQEILETTQQIAKFTESLNLSDYDLHETATREEIQTSPTAPAVEIRLEDDSSVDDKALKKTRRDTPAVQALEETLQEINSSQSNVEVRNYGERLSSSLESSPARELERYHIDSIGRSSSVERDSDTLLKEVSKLKHVIDVSSHSDSEVEQRKETSSRKRRKRGNDGIRGNDSEQDEAVDTDKFLSVEDLREVGIQDEVSQETRKDLLMLPNQNKSESQPTFESRGNRPPAAGRGSGSNRRKKGKKYLESPLSPIRDEESDLKGNVNDRQEEDDSHIYDESEKHDKEKFVYPPDKEAWEDENTRDDEDEEGDDEDEEYDNEGDAESGSSYLTSPGGLETVMEEQEEPIGDDSWTSKRHYSYDKEQRKRILTVSTDTIGEEIEDSSPEESKQILRLQDVPPGKRKSRDDEGESKGSSYDERKSKSPDHVPPERRMEKVHPRRSPEMRQDDRKEIHAKDRPPLSRVVDSTSPASSPVSTRFRFSPPITPKLCSTGKSFPEATFPKDLTPTHETAHHEDVVDENRNEIVDKQETTPTNEVVEFSLRTQHSAAQLVDRPRHSKKRHAVSTQTERRKSHREMSTQTRSEEEMQKQFAKEKKTKSFGVQAGEDLEIFLPKKVLVDVGVETESDVSSTSSPVSFASSRSVGIETDSRDPNLSSGMSSPISDVGGERCYSEMAVQTVSESFVQTDPIAFDQSEMVGSPYHGMDPLRHTSPGLSYQATQDPKVAQALRAVLGDFPPPTCRSYGMQASAGNIGGTDIKSSSPFKANGISEFNQHSPSDNFRSHGMQTSPLKLRDSSLAYQAASPSRSSGLSRPTSVSPVPDFPRRRPAEKSISAEHVSHPYRDTSAHVITSAIPDNVEARISHSDTESVDSDFGTPRIRRRLPHVPAGTSPSSSPVLGRSAGEDNGDLQAEIELDKVRGLLSRKAIQLEMERRKHELDEMTSKIFGQNQNVNLNTSQEATKQKSRAYTQQKFHTDGTLSDSDVVTHRKKLNQREPEKYDKSNEPVHRDKSESKTERKEQGKDSPMGMDKEKYVQFSKSEEDIIREIERQVTQATGKQYSALEQDGSVTHDKGKGSHLPDHDYEYGKKQEPVRQEVKKTRDDKRQDTGSREQYETELESQRYWDIDTSPVHTSEIMPFVKDPRQSTPKDEPYGLQPSRPSSSSAYSGVRRAPEGSERRKEPSRRTIPQLIKDNQNEVDRLSREGEEIERRIKELTELEEKLETDYQQYRTRIISEKQPRDYEGHPETLADYILKSHEPALRFEKTTDGQYEYTTAHWSNSDESLSGSGGKIASSSSESRLLPARPQEAAIDDREMESGLILPLEEGSDFDGDLSSGSPASQRREAPPEISSSLPSIPKRELPPVSVHHSETRHKQARQLPVPKGDPHVTRSEGHRAQANNIQQPPVPRRSRGERTSNIFHLKRNSNGPASGSGSGGDLGLRVVGGKRMPGSNQLVAYITDVVEGGVAQKTGLREGDQVLEWCGTPLTGKTFEEVQLIMRTARKMADVTVKCGPNLLDSPRYRVQRPSGREVQRSHHGGNAPRSSSNHRREQPSSGHRGEHPSRQVVRPTSEGKIPRITGELQIRLAYDAGRGELRVDVLRGRGLAGKTNDGLADPFVVVKLLPMKSASDEKRTACVPRTLTPEWNQTLLFRDLRPSELLTNHSLELTIWSSSRSLENYMGKVVFNLSDTKHLDNRVHWYRLMNGSSGQGKAHKNIGFV